jgi:transcriptional regulator with GAF, ATPase, and Fis domain
MKTTGAFRGDLLDRLNVFPVPLPPLRERKEDTIFFAKKFLSEFGKKQNKQFSLKESGEQALLNYPWPGNVRELGAVIERVAAIASSSELDERIIQRNIDIGRPQAEQTPVDSAVFSKYPMAAAIPFQEKPPVTRQRLIDTLKRVDNNRQRAAEIYGVDKTTIYRWLKKTGLEKEVPPKVGRPKLEFRP